VYLRAAAATARRTAAVARGRRTADGGDGDADSGGGGGGAEGGGGDAEGGGGDAQRGGKGMERGRWGWCSGGCRGSMGEARVGEALTGRISRFNGEIVALPSPPGPSRRAVQPTPRGAAGGSLEGLVKASDCRLERAALVGLEGLTERRWGG